MQHPASLLPEEEKTSISVLLVFSKSCSYVNSSSVPEDIFVKLLITNTLGPHIILIYYLDFKTSFLTNRKQKYHFHITLNKYKYKCFFRETAFMLFWTNTNTKLFHMKNFFIMILKKIQMPKNTNMNKDTKIFHREISFTSLSTNTTTSTNLRTTHTFL